MATLALVIILALMAFAFVAVPLLVPGRADPLPDDRDPVSQDLEEERDALFRAIREVEARADLPESRRSQLRSRYEAKAAHVLRALDEREARLTTGPARAPSGRRRFPYGAVALLALVLIAATALPGSLLPRIGLDANPASIGVSAAQQLATLQQAAEQDPSAKNLMALGDAYWSQQQTDNAIAAYQRIVDTVTPVPVAVYKRLAAAYLPSDLAKAYGYLQKALAAAPNDPQTLYAMGEVSFARNDLAAARQAFERYLATAGNSGDSRAREQVALIDKIEPLADQARSDPSEPNLMALGDAYWRFGDKNHAVGVYLRVLTGPNPGNATALGRIGQVMFLSGRSRDAITLLRRAAQAAGGLAKLEQPALLTLGSAYFSQQQYQDAIDIWNLYVRQAGGPDKAGRVAELIKSAEAKQQGLGATSPAGAPAGEVAADKPPTAAAPATVGAQLYLARCATCHGVSGRGGSGPALAGNPRAANAGNVQDAVRYGRGVMPGFQAELTKDQIATLVRYVTVTLAGKGR